jgi:hypothetical protein
VLHLPPVIPGSLEPRLHRRDGHHRHVGALLQLRLLALVIHSMGLLGGGRHGLEGVWLLVRIC